MKDIPLEEWSRILRWGVSRNLHWTEKGKLPEYIPALANVEPGILGITVADREGRVVSAGDCPYKFTIQSISKIFALIIALLDAGVEQVFSKVGMEPTGDPFNSIYKLETLDPAKPLNPMINAGAIAVTSLIKGKNAEERFARILELIRLITGNEDIGVNRDVFSSEWETGNRNRSLAYLMKDLGILEADVEETLELYFLQCAIEVTCEDLARMGVFLALNGRMPGCGVQIVPPEICRIVKTFMVTCGMYNASGEFAIKVGIPAKSGVGGGILALVPGAYGIGVVSPPLDEKGNSIAGVHLLEDISRELELSIF